MRLKRRCAVVSSCVARMRGRGLRCVAGLLLAAIAAAPLRAEKDFVAHVAALTEKVPAKGFVVLVEPPFVVISEGAPDEAQARSEHTVRWAVSHLKKLYFAKDPDAILDIWLFRDDASYRTHAKLLFNDTPDTPYGYFSQKHNALIMNIATGGGTLVHEICHPFMHANFPGCPVWFDEGLASLYEQSGQRDGRIVGLTNWRLAGLQEAIRQGKTVSFKDLCAMDRTQFYGAEKGLCYAEARYLCYALQERDLLIRFYREFSAAVERDPTGYATLCSVLGKREDEMSAWQKDWETWVLTLTFP